MSKFCLYGPIISVIISLNLLADFVLCDEITGCGGFIKSHADIDFSKVEVEL